MEPVTTTQSARHSGLGWFVVISFGLLWVVMVPAALTAHGVLHMRIPRGLQFLAEFAATIAAIAVTASMGGRASIKTLLRGLVRVRISFWWYVVVMFVPLVTQLAALGIYHLAGRTMPKTDGYFEWLQTVAFYLPICLAQEEIGWRGFFLDRLIQRYSLGIATLWMAAVWGLWHLPVFLARSEGLLYLIFLAGMIPASAWFSFVYSRTRSLLLCGIFHASLNAGLPNWLAPLPVKDASFAWGLWIGVLWLATIPVFIVFRQAAKESIKTPTADL